ncbi:GNAT family N-acetyltransferase [Solibacillus sp. FSL H8-0538]|uniref:GNAT family N-acetyltransferase n=1 Tax=Solibacillus sp. FSL H8-0538 TaxID=2921400 RepID=UPI0030FAA0A9
MVHVMLVPHDLKYAERMSQLSSAPQVKDAIALTDEQASLEGTISYIKFIIVQERQGKSYSRVILNEEGQLIGVITLKDINYTHKTCHIGTWIGHNYWGLGYNELAKVKILHTAFTELGMYYVFAGANHINIRSRKAQEKLPYISLHVEDEFPLELKKLEHQVKAPCVLHVIRKNDFLKL